MAKRNILDIRNDLIDVIANEEILEIKKAFIGCAHTILSVNKELINSRVHAAIASQSSLDINLPEFTNINSDFKLADDIREKGIKDLASKKWSKESRKWLEKMGVLDIIIDMYNQIREFKEKQKGVK